VEALELLHSSVAQNSEFVPPYFEIFVIKRRHCEWEGIERDEKLLNDAFEVAIKFDPVICTISAKRP